MFIKSLFASPLPLLFSNTGGKKNSSARHNPRRRKCQAGFHPNAVTCVACVAFGWKQQPIGCSVEAVATMIGCLPTQALAFSPVSIQTQRTQRKRLRLGGNRALDYGCTIHIHAAPIATYLSTGKSAQCLFIKI